MFRLGAADKQATTRQRDAVFETEALSFVNHLYAVAVRLTRNPAAAEDLVQDTYLKAFRFSGRFQPGTNLKAWLFSILYNTFRNDQRGARRNPVDVDSAIVERAVDGFTGTEAPDAGLLRRSMDPALRDALAALPDIFRQAVWLRDVEELSYAEIAEVLDVPVGTVMSRISRGRRQLFEQLSAARIRVEPAAVGGVRS